MSGASRETIGASAAMRKSTRSNVASSGLWTLPVADRCLSRSVVIKLSSSRERKAAVGAGEPRFDCSSQGMRFKRNRKDLLHRQGDGGREDPIGIETALEDPEPSGVAAISRRRLFEVIRPQQVRVAARQG